MRVTYKASPDVALVKYWGKKNAILRLPENGSISIILAGLETTTTVEFGRGLARDEVKINGEVEEGEEVRVKQHLDRVRKMAAIKYWAKVVSKNNFPKGTGLSSSGSGFAALTYAATKAAGLDLPERDLSILARQGSGTACRCSCGGFVEWLDGDTSETSYSRTLRPKDWWDIRDVVVVVDEGKKMVSSTEGHTLAKTSIFYQTRLKNIKDKIEHVKMAIGERSFKELGETIEAEALEFHSILLTSRPSMIAWYPGTVEVILAVQAMRREGVETYFTINTGFNVHVLTLPEFEAEVIKSLKGLSLVRRIIKAKVGDKPTKSERHLF